MSKGTVKWFNNQSEGIPAYISVDMTTQETTLVRLEDGIKYSRGEYFFRNLDRYLRFKYPTKIFDNISFEIDENGATYEENALIKARAVASCTDCLVMADDSGLEIDYLHGEPGIYSARYLGEDTPYSVKNVALLERLSGVPREKRTARFICAIAAVLPDGRELTARASIEGYIGDDERGEHGFGYDPIFWVPEFGRSAAELTEEEKNKISHRGKALQKMKEELRKYENNCG